MDYVAPKEDFIRRFVEDELGRKTKHSNFRVEDGKLVYTAYCSERWSEESKSWEDGRFVEGTELIAFRNDGTVFYNSNTLELCDTH